MKRTIIAAFLIAALGGCRSASNVAAHKLLDRYFENELATVSAPAKRRVLDELQTETRELKGKLPDNFYDRYARLVEITRLSLLPDIDANQRGQIVAYIQSITGQAPAKAGTGLESLQSLTGRPAKGDINLAIAEAFAFSEEVIRLDMLLDGETDREKVRQKYAEKFPAKRK